MRGRLRIGSVGVLWLMIGWTLAIAQGNEEGANVQQTSFDSDLLSLTQEMPRQVTVNEPYDVLLVVTGKREARDIDLRAELPAGTTLIDSVPEVELVENELNWRIHSLRADQQRSFRLRLQAAEQAELNHCLTVAVSAQACVSTQAGRPELLVRKTGPDIVLLGEVGTFHITVENVGTLTARDIQLVDIVPAGFTHESGQERLSWSVAALAPNELREFTVPLTAVSRGRWCNEARVTASNARAANSKVCTEVLKPTLELVKQGPDKQIIGRQARYTLNLLNSGDTILRDLTVVDTAPEGTRLVSAPGADIRGNTATWRVSVLHPGESSTLDAVLTTELQGRFCNRARVSTGSGLTAAAEACTQWIGHAGLLLELVDTADPLQVGDETEYVIMVKNQGSAPDTQITIKAHFPDLLTVIGTPGHDDAVVDGHIVTFTPLPELGPGKEVSWRIKVKAAAAGDARSRVEMSSTMLQQPVPEEESTHVY